LRLISHCRHCITTETGTLSNSRPFWRLRCMAAHYSQSPACAKPDEIYCAPHARCGGATDTLPRRASASRARVRAPGENRSGATHCDSSIPGPENRREQDAARLIAENRTGRPPMLSLSQRCPACVFPIRSNQGLRTDRSIRRRSPSGLLELLRDLIDSLPSYELQGPGAQGIR
jgi:hypothetical protein